MPHTVEIFWLEVIVNCQQVVLWCWQHFDNIPARIWKDDSSFWIKIFTTCQILILNICQMSDFQSKKTHNASDFKLKKNNASCFESKTLQHVRFLKQKFSKDHVLAHFTPWKRKKFALFFLFLQSPILYWKFYNASNFEITFLECVRFWKKNYNSSDFETKLFRFVSVWI